MSIPPISTDVRSYVPLLERSLGQRSLIVASIDSQWYTFGCDQIIDISAVVG